MKITVQEFSDKFRSLVGDETLSVPDNFIINALNWAFNSLPLIPRLDRAFSEHRTINLDANGHYRWKLPTKFRRIADLGFLHFYTSTGGDPCPLCICNRDNERFYAKNGLVSLKVSGAPCEYTIEREDDNTYVVLDRPSNVPILLDYIAFGFPKPVKSMEDKIEISAVMENLIISAMRRVWYQEASDFAFAESIGSYLDNKQVVEAIQMLNKSYGNEMPTILGGY